MMAARHLGLALALILGLAGATKRPRSSDSSDTEQSEPTVPATTTTTTSTSTSTGDDPVIEGASLHILKRATQIAGCLIGDAVACSGGFDDPVRHAAVLLSSVFAKKYPKYEPVSSLSRDLDPVELLRSELLRQKKFSQGHGSVEIIKAYAYQLHISAAQKLIELTFEAGYDGMNGHACSTSAAWDKHADSSEMILSAVNEVFMAAEKTTARFDRSVFVWPSGQSGNDPLRPEERLYAVAVVVMCRQLGVRPDSVFLITREFERSLPPVRPNWRRPAIQVIAMAAEESVRGIDLAELCRRFVEKLGISEKLDVVPFAMRYRSKATRNHEAKSKPRSMPATAGPATPLPLEPLAETLPTELREDFAEADRLLLIRSLQVACMLFQQAAADQRCFFALFFQASRTVSSLLKLSGHDLSTDLIWDKPELDFSPLDLLRVIAKADRRPDLSAVSTVGDVMIVAAQMIFRHLYLTLPVPFLAKVERFNVVKLPEALFRNMGTLANYLCIQGAPHIPSDSSTLTKLYETNDAIIWAAFRVLSKRRGNLDAAFVLCTREMSEKISIERQHLDYLIPAILCKGFDKNLESVESAVLDLLLQLVPGSKNSSRFQMPNAVSRAPGAIYQAPGVMHQVPTIAFQMPNAVSRAPDAVPRALGIMPRASGAVARAPSVMPRAPDAVPRALGIMPQASGAVPRAPSVMFRAPGVMHQAPGVMHRVPTIAFQMPNAVSQAPDAVPRALGIMPQASGAVPRAKSVMFRAPDVIYQAPDVIPQVPAIRFQVPAIQLQVPVIQLQAPVIQLQAPVITPQAATISNQVVMSDQAASKQPTNSTDQMVSKVMAIMEILFSKGGMSIRRLNEIPSMVLPFLPMDLSKAGELTSVNRLAATSQLQKLDAKLKRDRITFSDTDHVTVLMDALLAFYFLQKGAVFQLASIPRTHTSDISLEDKDGLTRLLVAALFSVTSMQPAERSTSAAFSELTKRLASAVEATTSS